MPYQAYSPFEKRLFGWLNGPPKHASESPIEARSLDPRDAIGLNVIYFAASMSKGASSLVIRQV